MPDTARSADDGAMPDTARSADVAMPEDTRSNGSNRSFNRRQKILCD